MRTEASIYRENSHNNESSPCRISGSSLTSSCHTIHPKSHPTSIIRCRYFRIQPFAVLDDFLPDKWSNEEKKKSFHGNYPEYNDQLYVTKRLTFCIKRKIQFLDVMREIRDKATRDFSHSKVFEAIWAFGGNPWTTYGTVTGCFIRIPAKRWLHCEWKKPA